MGLGSAGRGFRVPLGEKGSRYTQVVAPIGGLHSTMGPDCVDDLNVAVLGLGVGLAVSNMVVLPVCCRCSWACLWLGSDLRVVDPVVQLGQIWMHTALMGEGAQGNPIADETLEQRHAQVLVQLKLLKSRMGVGFWLRVGSRLG